MEVEPTGKTMAEKALLSNPTEVRARKLKPRDRPRVYVFPDRSVWVEWDEPECGSAVGMVANMDYVRNVLNRQAAEQADAPGDKAPPTAAPPTA